MGLTFYLFIGGAAWEGSDRCKASKAISIDTATASGLHLGQTPSQVIAILGSPTKGSKKELIYSFLVKKKTSAEDLKEARRLHPEMNEKDFLENYGTYDLGEEIRAKFVDSKLVYLAVLKVETN